MGKPKSIILEFMVNNPNDTFVFLMPLYLKPDTEKIANSHFAILVKNLSTNQYHTTTTSPELFFSRFKFSRPYKAGKLDRKFRTKFDKKYDEGIKRSFSINISEMIENEDVRLSEYLDDEHIGQLLNYHRRTYLEDAKKVRCCILKHHQYATFIIPHYALAIYYYHRSTTLREATFKMDLSDLYYGVDCNPDNASIIIPRYVSESDAPFIHRFLCQDEAGISFDKMATFIHSNMKAQKEKYKLENIDRVPIKAKFPVQGSFNIEFRYTEFYHKGKRYRYIHEILDDDSDIGFSKFTVFFQGKKIVKDTDDVDNLPTVSIKEPSETSEVLKSSHANKSYKQNRAITSQKNKCSSLRNIDISVDKITDEEAFEKLKIIEEKLSNEAVDQSLTDASGNGKKKIRKTSISTKGEAFKKKAGIEYIHNFEVFQQYMRYMRTQEAVQNLVVHENNKIDLVYHDDGTLNKKSAMFGRERQYITATFEYKNSFIGLLELENDASSSVGTWVISSKKPITNNEYQKFIKLYVNDNKHINDIKSEYKESVDLKFTTKYHEKNAEYARWMVGLFGKIIK